MSKKLWSIAVAFLFIASFASTATAQRRVNPQRKAPPGLQSEHPDNGNRGENPGNGNQTDPPGNGNPGEDPNDPPGGTLDGSTPAEEDTCDVLRHGSPGLYGLCIAFCEAHDCVPDFSLEDPFVDCKKNDRKILDKYRDRMKDGDPDMPCLPSAGEDPETACPCWSRDQLAYFPFGLSLSGVSESGRWGQTDLESTGDDDDCYQNMSYIGEYVVLSDGVVVHFDISTVSGNCDDGTSCSGSLFCEDGTCPDEVKPSDAWIDITPEEYDNCRGQIEQLMPYVY
jgi:hypothetical protein